MARHYFGTDGVRGIVGEDLTPQLVERLGRAVTLWTGGGAVFIDAVIKAVKQWRFAPTGEHQRFAEISVSFECCNTVTTTP